jgi:hypothetical protein
VNDEFQDTLRQGMEDAAASVTATVDLQRRLVDGATAFDGTDAVHASSHMVGRRWGLPLLAAVAVLAIAGSAALVDLGHATHQSSRPGVSRAPDVPPLMTPTSTSPPPPVSPTVTATATPARPAESHRAPAISAPAVLPSTTHATHPAVSHPAPAISAPSVSPSATQATQATRPAACDAPPSGAWQPTTQAEFTQKILGTWLVCSTPTVFGTTEDGLLISPDGHWAKLERTASGTLTALSGWGNEGTWQVLDDSAMNGKPTYQLNLAIDGRGTVITVPTISLSSPERIRLDNNGVFQADYVLTTEAVH